MENSIEEMIQDFRSTLKKKGFNITKERELILREVLQRKGHYDAETLYIAMKTSGVKVARSTVYRTLDVLYDIGVVDKSSFGQNQFYYERMIDRAHHDHLVCQVCDKIFEFVNEDIEKLQVQVCKENGFKMKSHSLQIFGVCTQCQEKDME